MQKIFSLISGFFFLVSCSKDVPSSLDFKFAVDYYPLILGSWYVYDIDSISYDDFTNPVSVDSITYQVKEELTDTFLDLEGNQCFEITRSKRMETDSIGLEDLPWILSDIWWVKEINGNIYRVEENNNYVTLSNPIAKDKSWDGNAYNYQRYWDFTYENIAGTFNQYSNTVTVIQIDQENEIEKKYYREIFANDIGLVSRIRIDVKTQDIINPLPILLKAEKGFQFFQELNSYYIP